MAALSLHRCGGPSLVVVSGGCSWTLCNSFSLQWLPCCRARALECVGSVVVAHRFLRGTPGSFNCPCTSWASGNLKGLENHSTASTAHSSTRRSGKLLTDPVQPFVLVWFCLGRGSSPHCVWISQHLGHPPSPGQGVLWWTMDGQCFTTTQYARDNQHHFIDREIGPSEGGAE